MPNEAPERRQARTFAAYLGSPVCPSAVAERYGRVVQDWTARDRFDAWLVGVAAIHPALASLADTYARFARPYGDLRRRLTLMLALLETHGATHGAYDRARPSGALPAWLALAATGTLWALRTVVATLICAPTQLLLGTMPPTGRAS